MKRTLVTHGAGVFLGRMIAYAAGLFTSMLIARALGPERFGQYSQTLWLGATIGMLVIFGFGNSVGRFIAEALGGQQPDQAANVAWGGIAIVGVVAAILASALVLWAAPIAQLVGLKSAEYVVVAAGIAVTAPMLTIVVSIFGGRQQFHQGNTIGTLAAVFAAALSLACLAALPDAAWLAACTIAGNGLACLVAVVLLRRRGWLQTQRWPEGELVRRFVRYSLIMGLIFVTDAIVWQRSELFFLGTYGMIAEVGYYSLAYTWASMSMMMIPGSVGALVLPLAAFARARDGSDGGAAIYSMTLRYTAILAFPLVFAMLLFGPPAITLVYGQAFAPAGPLLGVLAIGAAAGICAWNASSQLQAAERPGLLLIAGVLAGAFNILLDLLLIPPFAATGAAVANTVTGLVTAAAIMLLSRYVLGLHVPTLALGRVLAACLLAAVPAYVAIQAVDHPLGAIAVGSVLFGLLYIAFSLRLGSVLPEERLAIHTFLLEPLLRRFRRPAAPDPAEPIAIASDER